ncbi:MAG: hypothetical protein WD734_04280 [Dehalococcoidia bacterium]
MSGFNPGAALAGLVFIAAGTMFLLDSLGALRVLPGILLPVVVIALGISLVIGGIFRPGR